MPEMFLRKSSKKKFNLVFIFIGLLFFSLDLKAFEICELNSSEEESHVLDAKKAEGFWSKCSEKKSFYQFKPSNGAAPSQKTSAYVAVGKQNLYVFVSAYDSDPKAIRSTISRRDKVLLSDTISLSFDTYADSKSAFQFSVNPDGVIEDKRFFDDKNSDLSWDSIWYVETLIDEKGWHAEFKIPLSQLRFNFKKKNNWRFLVSRFILRNSEEIHSAPFPRGSNSFVSFFEKLEFKNKLEKQNTLFLSPYILGSLATSPKEAENPLTETNDFDYRAGLDISYPLSQSFNLDLTINPDFGQVESDPAVLNLSVFETFLPEKRSFFVEAKDLFSFIAGLTYGQTGNDSLFYSRRIGKKSAFDPEYSSAASVYEEEVSNTPILGAFKITGKTSDNLSVAFLSALTSKVKVDLAGEGTLNFEDKSQEIEPLTNYSVLRLRKQETSKDLRYGLILTSANRFFSENEGPASNQLENYYVKDAFTGGTDLEYFWAKRDFRFQLSLFASSVHGSSASIKRLQELSARYYQRPDADYLTLDPEKTELRGFGHHYILGKTGGAGFRYFIGGLSRTPGLELNDTGYLGPADRIQNYYSLRYVELSPGDYLRSYTFRLSNHFINNFAGDRDEIGFYGGSDFEFLNYMSTGLSFSYNLPRFDTRILRGGPGFMLPARAGLGSFFESDPNKDLRMNISSGYGKDIEVNDYSFWLSSSLSYRFSGRFDLSLSHVRRNLRDDQRYIDTLTDEQFGSRYIMAAMNQKIDSLSLRLNINLSPKMTVEIYGQNYFSSAEHEDFREVNRPKAKSYSDRFSASSYSLNEDFNYKRFVFNLVYRYQYDPATVIYLVLGQNREDESSNGDFDLSRDLKELYFNDHESVFLIKFSRTFGL